MEPDKVFAGRIPTDWPSAFKMRHEASRSSFRFPEYSKSVLAVAMVFGSTSGSIDAAERMTLAITEFDFQDTSGEIQDQIDEHASRLQLFGSTLQNSLYSSKRIDIIQARCQTAQCTGRTTGLQTLSQNARSVGARYLLVGEIKKMSTLVGQVKFTVLDLINNKPMCDRFLSYRGDTDEAWRRAAAFAANDIQKYCLPRQ